MQSTAAEVGDFASEGGRGAGEGESEPVFEKGENCDFDASVIGSGVVVDGGRRPSRASIGSANSRLYSSQYRSEQFAVVRNGSSSSER